MTITDVQPEGGLEVSGSAPVEFTHPGSVDSDIVIEWDFDNDGDFSEGVEDITSFVLSAEGETGRDRPSRITGQASPGRLRLTLLNTDDRFSHFNVDSPLNTGAFSLNTGRKIRVRTAEAANPDPTLLAYDEFATDGILDGLTSSGETWTTTTGLDDLTVANGAVVPSLADGSACQATFDVGVADYYVQADIGQLYEETGLTGLNTAALVVRFVDQNNFTYVFMSRFAVTITNVVAGVATDAGSYAISPAVAAAIIERQTLGVLVDGTDLTAYLDGAPVLTATAINTSATAVGIRSRHRTDDPPTVSNLFVWDGIVTATEGILWTGDVTKVATAMLPAGGVKVATVDAEGELGRLGRQDVRTLTAPHGFHTGVVIGNTVRSAGMLEPPGEIDRGTVLTGPLALPDGNAFSFARIFEDAELGNLYEMPEGPIAFQDRTARDSAVSQVTFTDVPGGQFSYTSIEPLDERQSLVNQVFAGVAPSAPTFEVGQAQAGATAAGVARNVTLTLPNDIDAGDMLVVVIVLTVDSNVRWTGPHWWVPHRGLENNPKTLKVFTHFCDGSEGGTNVTFYTDSTPVGGSMIAHMIVIGNWYGSYQNGLAYVEPVQGSTPPEMDHGWGRHPTIFIAANSGNSSSAGGSISGSASRPTGYRRIFSTDQQGNTNSEDCALVTAWKIDTTDVEAADAFSGLTGYTIEEAAILAIRGFNGPFTKATLDKPQTTGGMGQVVSAEDVDSQATYQVVRTHTGPDVFATETDAQDYCDTVIARHAEQAPHVAIEFVATLSDHYRNQAARRRVGDKVRVVADNDTGLGIDQHFFIEAIGHTWSRGAKVWRVRWELSPA